MGSGAIVMAVARDTQYLIGGRFFIGFGVIITTTAASTYVVEMSPPQVRFVSGWAYRQSYIGK
jgi:MFS family permease